MNAKRPPSLWTRFKAFAYDVTQWPGSSTQGYFPAETEPTLQRSGTFRSSAPGNPYNSGSAGSGETNTALWSPRQWALQAEEMQRSDGTVHLAVQGYLQTMGSPDWKWVPAALPDTATKVEREWADFYARFFADMWSRMSVSWDQQLQYLARFGLTGFRYAEQIDVVELAIADPNGVRHLRTMVSQFADCEPAAHYQWASLDGGRTLDSVVQLDQSSALGSVSIDREGDVVARTSNPRTDANRLLLLVHGQTGMNWDGDGGMMRPAWGAWNDKSNALNLRAVALDRFGTPTPHRKTNQAAMRDANYTDPQIEQASAIADTACQQWAGGESTHLGTDSNIEVEFIGGVFDASNFNDTIQACDQQIVMAMNQPFLIMGLGDSTGSRALSTQSASHFDVGVENDLDYIRDQVNGHARPGGGIVGRIMQANWPDVSSELWPRIEHAGLKADDFSDLVGTLSSLAAVGLGDVPQLMTEAFRRMGIEATPDTLERLSRLRADASTAGGDPELNGRPGTGRPALEGGAANPLTDRKPRVQS